MSDAPEGTIVRPLSCNDNPEAFGPDAWGVVRYDPLMTDHDETADWATCAAIFLRPNVKDGPEGYNQPANGNGIGWYFYDHELEFVPEDQVPDYVLVELAKWRLLNG